MSSPEENIKTVLADWLDVLRRREQCEEQGIEHAPLGNQIFQVFTPRDGLIIRVEEYPRRMRRSLRLALKPGRTGARMPRPQLRHLLAADRSRFRMGADGGPGVDHRQPHGPRPHLLRSPLDEGSANPASRSGQRRVPGRFRERTFGQRLFRRRARGVGVRARHPAAVCLVSAACCEMRRSGGAGS
jgi:hypothetical protein